jgi:hypothetical protein
MKQRSWLALMELGILVLAVTAANAQVRVRPGPEALHDRECVKECRDDLDACLEDAADDLYECAEPCADERAAVREACGEDPTSQACADARAALRECIAPCLGVYHPAVAECFGDARECGAECPPVTDIPCVRACFEQRAECLADLRAEVKACRDRCRAEVMAARRLCADDSESEECRAATAAAKVCLAPCGKLIRTGLHECRRETRACLAECDEEDPVTDGSSAAQ